MTFWDIKKEAFRPSTALSEHLIERSTQTSLGKNTIASPIFQISIFPIETKDYFRSPVTETYLLKREVNDSDTMGKKNRIVLEITFPKGFPDSEQKKILKRIEESITNEICVDPGGSKG